MQDSINPSVIKIINRIRKLGNGRDNRIAKYLNWFSVLVDRYSALQE